LIEGELTVNHYKVVFASTTANDGKE